MANKLFFTIACVVLPVVWGIVVNWIFQFWAKPSDGEQDPIFPDYQI